MKAFISYFPTKYESAECKSSLEKLELAAAADEEDVDAADEDESCVALLGNFFGAVLDSL